MEGYGQLRGVDVSLWEQFCLATVKFMHAGKQMLQ